MEKYQRLPATVTRGKRLGQANQMAHERKGKADRMALIKKLHDSHEEARRVGAKKVRKPQRDGTGLNAGTMGRSRVGASSDARSFFLRK